MNTLLHSHITDKILGCAIAVHRELGPGRGPSVANDGIKRVAL